ncbi:VCBS repeat protein [Leeuwenhoekiella polynyae]|uniref:VCBS repeat protein n=1 Tax=Leeuwenhoekiella polynyae TaxID=1550906 RepID=A0A4Q0PC31_9FLAO|nr:VCBS repeat protein [Leeuwenhoekiella polynyae]
MKSSNHILFIILIFSGFLVVGCKEKQPLFLERSIADTGVDFENTLVETPDYNVLTYEYFYNGAGVGVGDLNGDGLADVYLSGNQVENKLFLNKGDFKFQDITQKSGIQEKKCWKTGVSIVDVNGDGLLDIYLSYSGNAPGESATTPVRKDYKGRSNQLFINTGNSPEGIPVFEEKAQEYGLSGIGTFSTQAYFLDYDLDGDLDMFLLNHANKFYNTLFNVGVLRKKRHPYYGNKLFKNNNNFFEEVSEEAGIIGSGVNFGLSAAISDLNQDGYPDVYVTNDYEEQDFLYLNNGDGTFKEITKTVFGHLSNFGMGSDIADINNDGLQDIFVADMWPEDNYRQKALKGPDQYNRYQRLIDSGYHYQYMRNTLQLNRGLSPKDSILRFSEVGQLFGVSNTDWSWAPLLADYDNDGRKDLFITNGFLRDFSNLDFLNYTVNNEVQKAQDNQQAVDLPKLISEMPATKIANYAYQNTGSLKFKDVTKEWGLSQKTVSNAAAYADFDNDGDLDLIINNLNQPVLLYENTAQNQKNNFIKIKLEGTTKNTLALGAKVYVNLENGTSIFQEAYYGRGYQSSVEPIMTIGLGEAERIKNLQVIWPSKTVTELDNLDVNQTLTLSEKNAKNSLIFKLIPQDQLLTDITQDSQLNFKHTENNYVDFNTESLIPYQLSRMGGKASVADVNADGNDDVYLEGARGQTGILYLGTDTGTLEENNINQPWTSVLDSSQEDTASLFFDADGDQDLDLYIVSGGNEKVNGDAYYQDRLYINDGKGSFRKAENSLPDMKFSGGVVTASDFDKDGDLDIFVGGRLNGNSYPLIPRSTILLNDGNAKFLALRNFDLEKVGMVTDAVWEDINADSWPDLVLVGEWMPITIFINTNGILTNQTQAYGLADSNGWWLTIKPHDIDNDGDTDFLLGNLGANIPFTASPTEPMRYYIQDIDNNGRIDPILTHYINGVSYPVPGRDELLGQVPRLKKHYKTYESYAATSTDDLLKTAAIKPRFTYQINELKSSYLENTGDGKFKLNVMPEELQVSAIQDFVIADFDADGQNEILAAGNLFPFRVNIGRLDASFGTIFTYDSGKILTEGFTNKTWLDGDVRYLAVMNFNSGEKRLLVTRNDDFATMHKIKNSQ